EAGASRERDLLADDVGRDQLADEVTHRFADAPLPLAQARRALLRGETALARVGQRVAHHLAQDAPQPQLPARGQSDDQLARLPPGTCPDRLRTRLHGPDRYQRKSALSTRNAWIIPRPRYRGRGD